MKRILIANPFGIGDVLFSMASVERLREVYPDAFLGFICNERTEDLLKLCPSVNQLYVFSRDSLREAWRKSPLLFLQEINILLKTIARDRYDALFDFSLGREFSLAAFLIGIRERIGFDYKGRGIFLTRKKNIKSYGKNPVAQEQVDLLQEFKILPDDHMPEKILIHVPEIELGLENEHKVLAIAPGGGKSWGKNASYKQWEVEKFAETVNQIIRWKPGTQAVLLGDAAEEALLRELKSMLNEPPRFVLVGESMEKVCTILKKSDLLLCNDGGLLHLAHALGTKTVAIFGPVDEKIYGPYGGPAQSRVLVEQVPCRPCYKNFYFPACFHERRCLAELSSDKVIEAVKEIL